MSTVAYAGSEAVATDPVSVPTGDAKPAAWYRQLGRGEGLPISWPYLPPGEPGPAKRAAHQPAHGASRLGENPRVSRSLRFEQSVGVCDVCTNRVANRSAAVGGNRADRADLPDKGPLGQGIYPQMRFLTWSHSCNVALGHPELELERIGPSEREEQISLLEGGAHQLLHVRSQHDAAGGRAEGGELDLLVQQTDLSPQRVGPDPVQPLLRRIAPARGQCRRRSAEAASAAVASRSARRSVARR